MTQTKAERTTSIGLARFAYEYIDAAMLVDNAKGEVGLLSQASYTPAYFLALHGIELCFKSFLLHKGVAVESLGKDYGHNLQKCLIGANARGLNKIFEMNEDDTRAFNLLIELNREHQLRYIQTGFKNYPLWSIVEPFAVRLHQAVAEEVGYHSFNKHYPTVEATKQPAKKNEIRRGDVEQAFIRMLSRVGGGFKFSGWLEDGRSNKERSDLSKQTDADITMGLFGSDYKNESHIVGYVGVTRIDGTLRIKAEIDYYEEIGEDIENFIGTSDGKVVSSESSVFLPVKGYHHKGIGDSIEMLYGLIERFNKNIAQF